MFKLRFTLKKFLAQGCRVHRGKDFFEGRTKFIKPQKFCSLIKNFHVYPPSFLLFLPLRYSSLPSGEAAYYRITKIFDRSAETGMLDSIKFAGHFLATATLALVNRIRALAMLISARKVHKITSNRLTRGADKRGPSP